MTNKVDVPIEVKKSNEPINQQQQIFLANPSITSFSGPVPPPNFLLEYEKIHPGIAKKFLEGPSIEAEHRRNIETLMIQEQISLNKRGQWMAFFLAILCLSVGMISISLGFDLAGFGTLLISISVFAGVFIYSKKQK